MSADKRNERCGVALVTGAAGIIGPGICATLRADGWTVAAADISEEEFEVTARYQDAVQSDGQFYADLSKGQDCERLIAEVEERLGPIGLLVNNAAMPQAKGEFGEVRRADYERLVNINLLAPFFLTQSAFESLKQTGGAVIMISSVLSRLPRPGATLYGVTKAALEKQTEYLAFELSRFGIRVNAIRVGGIPGAHFMRETLRELPEEQARELCEEVMKVHQADVVDEGELPLLGTPNDIAQAIRYLASDDARMVNGTTLAVDGGLYFRDSTMERVGAKSARARATLKAALERLRNQAPSEAAK